MPSYGAAVTQAKSGKKVKKELSHVEVREAENGGHSVTHHFTSFEHEPETHVFGKDEGPNVLHHVAEAVNIDPKTMNAETTHDLTLAEDGALEEIED